MKETDLLKEARERFELASSSEQENRDLAVSDLRFQEGGENQWSEEVRSARKGRPCLTVNRLPTYVDQITGQARQNRPQISIRPVGASPPDAVVSESGVQIRMPMHDVVNGLVRSIEYRSNAESAYDTAIESAVQCGKGAFRVTTEYVGDDTFEQQLRIVRIPNPMTVYIDPLFQEQDASDMRWCFVTERMPRKEFESEYPDAGLDDFDSGMGDDDSFTDWVSSDHVRIAEYWKKVPVEKTIYQLSDGRVVDAVGLRLARRQDPSIRRIRSRTLKTHEVRWWKLGGNTVLDGGTDGNLWPGKHIPICVVWGKELNIGGRRVWKSAIRDAKDPARMLNYWTSAIAENIALAPKAPYLVTPTMVEGFEGQWSSMNSTPRPYLLYTPDPTAPGGRPIREPGTMLEPALITERQQCIDDIKATTGIFDASLGARSNEQSGRAILARRQQGDNATFAFIDNLSKAVRYCGKVIVDALPHIIDTERVETLRMPSGETQEITLNWTIIDPMTGEPTVINDLTRGRWEVAVTVGPAYATQRMESADSMMQFVQALPQSGQFISDLVASAMDWPKADVIADRLKRTIPPEILGPQDMPEDMQQQQQQAQQQPDPNAQAAEVKLAQEQIKLEQEKVKLQISQVELAEKQARLQAMMTPPPAMGLAGPPVRTQPMYPQPTEMMPNG